MLTLTKVANLLGPDIKPKTVSTYLTESREWVGRGERRRKGRYADHPFPAPDDYHGKAPWWDPDRADEILIWRDSRPGQGVGGGRPRQSD